MHSLLLSHARCEIVRLTKSIEVTLPRDADDDESNERIDKMIFSRNYRCNLKKF